MSIWTMTGAELSREIGQPAPITVLRGGHNDSVAGIVAQIAMLPAGEREALLASMAAALKPEPKRLSGGQSYRTSDEFFSAFNAARAACRAVHGSEWYLSPAASLKARVPAAWVTLKGEMGTYRSPRDVNFPRAEFWPGGVLPNGPEYAEHGPCCPIGGAWAEHAARPTRKALAFALEPTPECIDDLVHR